MLNLTIPLCLWCFKPKATEYTYIQSCILSLVYDATSTAPGHSHNIHNCASYHERLSISGQGDIAVQV